MKYTIYKLDRPFGEPADAVMETNNRTEAVKKVAELLRAGEPPEMYRMVEDKSIPDLPPVMPDWGLG